MSKEVCFELCGRDLVALNLDEFLDSIDDEDVFVAVWTLLEDSLISGTHVPILERFFVGLVIV